MEASSEFHAPASLTPERYHGTHLIGGWVDFLTCLTVLEKRKCFLCQPGFEPTTVLPIA